MELSLGSLKCKLSYSFACCSAPGTKDNMGDLMKNNAPVGGAIVLDNCKVPTFAQGPPSCEADDMCIKLQNF